MQHHDGDLFAAIFGILPSIFQKSLGDEKAAGANLESSKGGNKGFAAMWVSASCERHGSFLRRLMSLLPGRIDSMGSCFHNRDERYHPALRRVANSSLWWGTRVGPTRSGELKMAIASDYDFFISIENTILDDYVTEKFFQVQFSRPCLDSIHKKSIWSSQ